jgi:hypothetical protein
MHDLAGLDGTSEAEATEIHARLVAEGRIDPQESAASHQRLLVRLRKQARRTLATPKATEGGFLVAPSACA